MRRFRSFIHNLGEMTYTLLVFLLDAARFLVLCLRPAPTLAAENLFLRKQLAQYQERHVKPRRANDATRMALIWLSRFFDWRRVAGDRAAGDPHPLAPPGLSTLLAVEIQTGATSLAQGLAGHHPSYGPGESHLGARTHHQRTPAQTRPAGLSTNRAQIHARSLRRQPRQTRSISTLVHIYPQSCYRHCSV